MSGALVFSLDAVDRAVKRHVEWWISDYLGLWEERMQITRDNTTRPNKGSYRRAEEFPPQAVEQAPTVYVVSNGFPEGSISDRPGSSQTWARIPISVGVTFGEPEATSYKLGVLPRLYMNALVELFKQKRILIDSPISAQVVSAIAFTEPQPVGEDRWAHTLVGLEVDAPVADLSPSFYELPDAPNLPSRDPDVPVTIDTLNVSVEATP